MTLRQSKRLQEKKQPTPTQSAPKVVKATQTKKPTKTTPTPKRTITARKKATPQEEVPASYTKVRPLNRTPPNMRPKQNIVIRTLQDAYDYIDGDTIGDTSKEIYKERLRLLCEDMKSEKLDELLSDPEKVIEAIKNSTYKNDPSKLLSQETHKLILTAIRVITQRGAVKSVGKEEQKRYEK
jgi:hypothetical protein